ncbi:MAG TPA: polysaccharide biosynthesis tyrosine autokinase [Spirochaetia bacterium]|nr:polysaccharide biosynthesis tyrosine autokinase [Spirochaetia bacterium]
MGLSEVLEVVRRRGLAIVGMFLLVVASAGVYVFLATPQYEADCKLLLVEDKPLGLGLGMGGAALGSDLLVQSLGKSDPIATQMEIVRTRPILDRVIELAGLTDRDGRPLTAAALRRRVRVEAVRNTNLIAVSYRSADPAQAARVVNTLARVFTERNQKLNQEELASTGAFLESQLSRQKQALAEAEQAVLDFKKRHGSFSLEEEAQALVSAQVQLEARRRELDADLSGARAVRSDLQSRMEAPGAVSDRFYSYWSTTAEQTNGQITGLLAQQDTVRAQIEGLGTSLGKLPPQEVELARLTRDESIAADLYTSLLQESEEVRMNEAAKIASIRLVEPAVVPDAPASPQKVTYLLAAACVGLLLGFCAAMILDRLDDAPRSLEEVKALLPYDILGYIPAARSGSRPWIGSDPQSAFSEAFRLVLANLRFKPAAREKRFSFMVTSATAGEGKSTLAANLSFTLGTNGTRAALVSLDLRRPSFDAIFQSPMDRGVTDYLIGESKMEEIMFREDGRSLTIIPSGSIPPNPSELVTSHRLREMIRTLSESFDVVVYDTPPITLVAETLDLSRQVNGIVLVVDLSVATRGSLKAMNELIGNKGLTILGVILNKVAGKGFHAPYYGAYRYAPRGERRAPRGRRRSDAARGEASA